MSERVLIRTLPVRNGNYGGVLQAFALASAIDKLGYEAVLDVSIGADSQPALMRALRVAKGVMVGKYSAERILRPKLNSEIQRWVESNVRTTQFFAVGAEPTARTAAYKAMVVGSDQVWRKAYNYNELANYLLAFSSRSDVKRIAYAASFGTDALEGFTEADIALAKVELAKFDAVSVRERSGASLLEFLGVARARVVLDPTMLLPRSIWSDIATPGKSSSSSLGLTYVLDRGPEKSSIIASIEDLVGVRASSFEVAPPVAGRHLVGWSESLVKRNPSEWLREFRDAAYVVTDSFHGCVFSILFEKPFFVVPNPGRGLTRFDTLLSTFGLEDRIVSSAMGVGAVVRNEIDWGSVRSILDRERSAGLAFLREALA